MQTTLSSPIVFGSLPCEQLFLYPYELPYLSDLESASDQIAAGYFVDLSDLASGSPPNIASTDPAMQGIALDKQK